jgi:1,4-alpha-glucan branching enzyme
VIEQGFDKVVSGMGSIPHSSGVAFRVWAPNAEAVFVTGSFNNWSNDSHPMTSEHNGYWFTNVPEAAVGNEYRFRLVHGDKQLWRIDPYARQVTSSIGNAIVVDPTFDWSGDSFKLPPINEMVIYELHLGTFHDPDAKSGDMFAQATLKLDHLKQLGINVIEVMPIAEFAGFSSWGYNPACIFAVEANYGNTKGLKNFVLAAHRLGIGVVLDVVYNHFGPSDLDLWQFDGWSENGLGGIYFYNDWRAKTPWGDTRPDYGRPEVRQFIRDNVVMWLEEYHIDGLRLDMTVYIHNVNASNESMDDLPDGWNLLAWINRELRERFPGKITIAEDLRDSSFITQKLEHNGIGFTAQWDSQFVHRVRRAIITPEDKSRSLDEVRLALEGRYNGDPFQRVVYSESHDEIANGKSRLASEIDRGTPDSWYAQKRTTVTAAIVLTAPGVPMLFQGQEFLEDGWFQDTDPLDWQKSVEFGGLVKLYQDLIHLRLNCFDTTRGLTGSGINAFHQNQADNVLAYHRWYLSGPGDDVVVVLNLSHAAHENYRLRFPREGKWLVRFNSDWNGYSADFANTSCPDILATNNPADSIHDESNLQGSGYPAEGVIRIGPYSALILSQDKS